ncbi:MAG TPA: hypothetical protein VNX68_01140 [Nitrosopumilaceae archaeon]|jgi:hypothetical protein|nr:hypothetical protein [Nitrosopumilaceae archaeon]
MNKFISKPDDFDFILYGENTRFVIVEKREDISSHFDFKMRFYWTVTRKLVLLLLGDMENTIEVLKDNIE